jgi:NAD(P)-dependent dehydrogenase (short-subunit alcohol dehydrogenase family)
MPSLKDRTVLVIGRGSGIAGAIVQAASETGGHVIAAGRHPDGLAAAYRGMDVSPGTIDTGAYDALGNERKAALFAARSAANPARRIGTAEDVAAAALTALTNAFLTGVSIPVDGGEHLV